MIAPTASGKWRVRVKIRGKFVASATFSDYAEAVGWEQTQILEHGELTSPDATESGPRVRELLTRYFEERRGAVSANTWDTEESNLRIHLPASLAEQRIRTSHRLRSNVSWRQCCEQGRKALFPASEIHCPHSSRGRFEMTSC